MRERVPAYAGRVEGDASSWWKVLVMASKFTTTALSDPNWTIDGVGEGGERRLLQEFNKCHSIYARLKPQSQEVISDITQRIAVGMTEFVGKDLG